VAQNWDCQSLGIPHEITAEICHTMMGNSVELLMARVDRELGKRKCWPPENEAMRSPGCPLAPGYLPAPPGESWEPISCLARLGAATKCPTLAMAARVQLSAFSNQPQNIIAEMLGSKRESKAKRLFKIPAIA
jgi:hypothetical protein